MSEPPDTSNWPSKLVVSPMMYRLCVRHWGKEWCSRHLLEGAAVPASTFDELDWLLHPEKHRAKLGPREFPPGAFPEGRLASGS